MNPDRWARVQQIFHAALEISSAHDRQKFIDSSCSGDMELRAEVASLLKANEEAGDYLQPSDGSAETSTHLVAVDTWIGKRVGGYEIIERIERGGMGVIYRAEDLRLKRSAALKFLSEELARDAVARERFEREARAASALNHPNICTIYGVDESDGHPFLAMEMLRGQTLRQAIAEGPLATAKILKYGIEIANALEAAHSSGIIHRDIKPSNIFITDRDQVKVLDFGLATESRAGALKGDLAGETVANLTIPGMAIGTVAYMSPEQAMGERLDPRSDLFSLGAVLYEIATAQQAFSGRSPMLIFDAILHREPPPVSQVNPSIDSRLGEIIRKSLAKDPEHRFQNARDLKEQLERVQRQIEAGTSALGIAGSETISPIWKKIAVGAGSLALLAAIAYLVWHSRRGDLALHGADSASEKTVVARRSIAVLGFKNLTGRPEDAWLSTAFSEMLSTELAAGGQLRVIPGENVARTRAELKLIEADSYSADTLKRIRRNLGADFIVLGSYLTGEDQGQTFLRVDMRLQDAAGGETIATISERGTEAKLADMLTLAGTDLRAKLGVLDIEKSEVAKAAATLPSNQEAARLYSEGLAKLRQFDPLAARDLLVKAVAAEPDHPLIHAALASAWDELGFDAKAAEEARLAASLSAQLPQSEQLWVEGLFREATNDWDKAIGVYRSLLGIFPDNIEYGLRLASAQTSGARGKDALATVESLRALPAPARDDPRLDLAEGAAANQTADFTRGLESARRAAAKADAQGAEILKARSLALEAGSFEYFGKHREAADAADQAIRIYQSLGYKSGAAGALQIRGNALNGLGETEKSRQSYAQSLELAQSVGNQSLKSMALNNLAILYDQTGNLKAALKTYQEALSTQRIIGNAPAMSKTLGNIALNLQLQGDLVGAEKAIEEAIALAKQVGQRSVVAVEINTLGEIQAQRGQLEAALKSDRDALALAKEVGDVDEASYAMHDIAIVLVQQDQLAEARKTFESSLKQRQDIGAKGMVAESKLEIANLLLEEGKPKDAIAFLAEARPTFEKNESRSLLILSDVTGARASLAAGQLAEAQRLIARAKKSAVKNEDMGVKLNLAIAEAQVLAESGKRAAAKNLLDATLKESRIRGYGGIELYARLELGKLAIKESEASGRAQLADLAKDARALGFQLVARKAIEAGRGMKVVHSVE